MISSLKNLVDLVLTEAIEENNDGRNILGKDHVGPAMPAFRYDLELLEARVKNLRWVEGPGNYVQDRDGTYDWVYESN